jgi:hemoglobin/transferrin/lactoferrin receptor protein
MTFWKPSFRKGPSHALAGLFVGLLWMGVGLLVWAPLHGQTPVRASQPPAAEDVISEKRDSPPPELRQIRVQSASTPIPFATVLNVNSGHAAAADANGVVTLPQWGLTDTLQFQSLGFEPMKIAPGSAPLQSVELQAALVEIEEVVVQSNADVMRTSSLASMAGMASLPVSRPVVTVETTGDLLEGSGQVSLQMSQQGGASPVLRGFEANRVLLFVDGVRMNNAIYRAGHLQNAGSVDPFAVSRTEIVMGPTSVMYGSDALGGVVHFRTPTPTMSSQGPTFGGRVLAQGSTVNGAWAGHVQLLTRGEHVGTVTHISRRSFGNLTMGRWRAHGDSTWGKVPWVVQHIDGRDTVVANSNPDEQVPTGYDQWDFQHRMAMRWGGTHLDLNLQHSTTSDVPRFDVYNDVSGGTLKWAEWMYGPQRRSLVALTLNQAVVDMRWTTVASYQKVQEERIKRRFGQDERVVQLEELQVLGLTSTLWGRRGLLRWEVGMDSQWNDVMSTAQAVNLSSGDERPDLTRYADGGATMHNLGVFAAAQRSVGSQMLRSGLRYSHAGVHALFVDTTWLDLPVQSFDQRQGALTGIASLDGPWGDHVSGTTSLSSGFRHPNVDDIGKVREKEGYVLVPNAELKPEYIYTLEQGVRWRLKPQSDVLWSQGSVYASLWTDAIVQANASLAGDTMLVVDGDSARIQMNQNMDRVFVRGARWELGAKLWPNTTLRSVINWTYGNSLDGQGEPISHIPPTFGVVELSKQGRVGLWSTSVRYALRKPIERYGPDATDNPQEALPGGTPAWFTWNVVGTLKITESVELRVSGLNLLDMHYRTFGSGISAPGRNVRGTLTARF